jgi:hypothetical protein
MSLLSTLDYFGMCKPIWKIINNYFTIPNIKGAKFIKDHKTGPKIEISFEDKDIRPFLLVVENKNIQNVWHFQELRCVYWSTPYYDFRWTLGEPGFRWIWHAYNLATNEQVESKGTWALPPIGGRILKPEDVLKTIHKGPYRMDGTNKTIPKKRKRDLIMIQIAPSPAPCAFFFTNWDMCFAKLPARVI